MAALTIITLLTLTGLFQRLPQATLAAVVIAAVIELIDLPALAALYRVYTRRLGRYYGVAARPDFIAAVAALLGVLVFGTLPGLFIGIAISLLLLIYRASPAHRRARQGPRHHRPVRRPGTPPREPAAARHRDPAGGERPVLRQRRRGQAKRPRPRRRRGTRVVVLDAETAPTIDVTAVHMLAELAESLEREGVRLLVTREIGQVRDVVGQVATDTTPEGVYPTVQAAVHAAQQPPDTTSPGVAGGGREAR